MIESEKQTKMERKNTDITLTTINQIQGIKVNLLCNFKQIEETSIPFQMNHTKPIYDGHQALM